MDPVRVKVTMGPIQLNQQQPPSPHDWKLNWSNLRTWNFPAGVLLCQTLEPQPECPTHSQTKLIRTHRHTYRNVVCVCVCAWVCLYIPGIPTSKMLIRSFQAGVEWRANVCACVCVCAWMCCCYRRMLEASLACLLSLLLQVEKGGGGRIVERILECLSSWDNWWMTELAAKIKSPPNYRPFYPHVSTVPKRSFFLFSLTEKEEKTYKTEVYAFLWPYVLMSQSTACRVLSLVCIVCLVPVATQQDEEWWFSYRDLLKL